MKEKILAAITAKFPKVNLSKARKTQIAAFIEKKVIDDEAKIDAALDEYNEFNPLADIAKSDDKMRDLESKVKPATEKEPKEAVKTEEDDETIPADTPEWAKALILANKQTQQKLAALEGEKIKGTLKSKLESDLLKDVPASYWSEWSIPEKEEDLPAFAEKVKTGYGAFEKDLTDKGISLVPTPGGPSESKDAVKKASEAETKSVLDSIMP